MLGTSTRKALVIAVGCLFLAGCGPAKPATAAGPTPAATSSIGTSTTKPAAVSSGGNGLTACDLITEQDASTAIGAPAGPGAAGGAATLSECIYGDGALIISMKTDGKAFYDTEHTAANAKGATDVPGVGDSAFQAGTDQNSTLAFLKGTTVVSILLNGTGAHHAAVAIAKIAASKL